MSWLSAVYAGRIMDEDKGYNDATQGNGDWPSWRRLVLSQLETLDKRIKAAEAKQAQSEIDREVMKSRLAIIFLAGAAVAGTLVDWLINKFSA